MNIPAYIKPLPFEEGDEVEVYFNIGHTNEVFRIVGTVLTITDGFVTIRKKGTLRQDVRLLRDVVFSNFEDAKEDLIKLQYKRIQRVLANITDLDKVTEALEWGE